jgi:hypothetical protein
VLGLRVNRLDGILCWAEMYVWMCRNPAPCAHSSLSTHACFGIVRDGGRSLTVPLLALAAAHRAAARGGALKGPMLALGNLKEPTGKQCHVFISHAGEQKHDFVDFVKKGFEDHYANVKAFVDEYDLQPGDAAMEEMHKHLGDAFVGECGGSWHSQQA